MKKPSEPHTEAYFVINPKAHSQMHSNTTASLEHPGFCNGVIFNFTTELFSPVLFQPSSPARYHRLGQSGISSFHKACQWVYSELVCWLRSCCRLKLCSLGHGKKNTMLLPTWFSKSNSQEAESPSPRESKTAFRWSHCQWSLRLCDPTKHPTLFVLISCLLLPCAHWL